MNNLQSLSQYALSLGAHAPLKSQPKGEYGDSIPVKISSTSLRFMQYL